MRPTVPALVLLGILLAAPSAAADPLAPPFPAAPRALEGIVEPTPASCVLGEGQSYALILVVDIPDRSETLVVYENSHCVIAWHDP